MSKKWIRDWLPRKWFKKKKKKKEHERIKSIKLTLKTFY